MQEARERMARVIREEFPDDDRSSDIARVSRSIETEAADRIEEQDVELDRMRRELGEWRNAADGEPVAWHRSKSFTFHFSPGKDRPKNATSNPDEWTPLYASPRAAIASRPRAVEGKIVELEWLVPDTADGNGKAYWRAATSFEWGYRIHVRGDRYALRLAFVADCEPVEYDTFEAAKTAAQADYDRRILEAIVPPA